MTKAAVGAADIARLEGWIDTLEASLPPLRRFILAGGSPAGAALHLARTTAGAPSAPWSALLAGDAEAFEADLLVYVNRLSDLLFVMARRREPARGDARNRVVSPELAGAYAYCERLARSHYENFPVASRLLPARMRPHVAAIYAFARLADDMADEGDRPAADRIADLDAWGACLDRGRRSAPSSAASRMREVFVALRHSIDACRLPVQLLHDLLSAFRQDVTVKRYETWDDLLDYCRRSANPVGRLVLRVAGYDTTRARRRVRRRLHGAAADEFLAGSRGRLGEGAVVHSLVDVAGRRRDRERSRRARLHDAGAGAPR